MLLQIKKLGDPTAEWQELRWTNEGICPSELSPWEEPVRFGHISFSGTVKISRKAKNKLLQMCGARKIAKLSYQTVKRDCAKRNRR